MYSHCKNLHVRSILVQNHCVIPASTVTWYLYFYFHWQERQRKLHEEQRDLIQQQAQAKAQMLRYDDELARKRIQVLRVK